MSAEPADDVGELPGDDDPSESVRRRPAAPPLACYDPHSHRFASPDDGPAGPGSTG